MAEAESLQTFTVLVVEDDVAIRQYFANSVSRHKQLRLLGVAGGCREAQPFLAMNPDVMLVDLGLPDCNGAELIRSLKAASPQSEAIVITIFADEFRVIEAIRAGATGYILKDAMPDDIGTAVMEMLAGISPISPAVARYIINALRPDPSPENSGDNLLSPRELEVLQLVARGYSREEIARLIDLSCHTVVAHIRSIYKKLQVHSRSEAVYEAYQMGLIKLND